jgi:bis(5'-nucleosyl)-tetraphosphatase (symmetrical)
MTRLRFCTPEGVMDLRASGGLHKAPPGLLPWFDVPGRKTAGVPIAFGHWSTLGYLRGRTSSHWTRAACGAAA